MVQSVSSGNLKNEMDTKLIKRQDELGDLSKAISSLQEEMIKSIANIAGNAEAVLMASGELGETARETTTSMRQVEGAIDSIMQSAATQAEISDKAAKNVHSMGEKIERTTEEMEQMQQNADAMSCAEKQNVETIRELLESNKEVQELIQEIAAQTAKTNESVVQIKEATEIDCIHCFTDKSLKPECEHRSCKGRRKRKRLCSRSDRDPAVSEPVQ